MPVAPKRGTPGPEKWQPGNKLMDWQVFHNSKVLTKYPGRTAFDADSSSNDSMYKVLKRPEMFLSIDAFAAQINASKTEMLNPKRFHYGYSEAAGALQNLDHIIKDGVARYLVSESDDPFEARFAL